MCATLSPKARDRFARKAGSCPALYRQQNPKKNPADKYLMVSRVRMKGDDRATVDVGFGGGTDKEDHAFKLYASKIDGEWFLYIKRAAQGAPA